LTTEKADHSPSFTSHFSMHQPWTAEDDLRLHQLVLRYSRHWATIAGHFPGRDRKQVATRWKEAVNPRIIKGRFTKQEDDIIVQWATQHAGKDWSGLSEILTHRTPKQCRERWIKHLDPNVNNSPWTPQEEQFIRDRYSEWGPKWSRIAELLPGRTDDGVKNRWNSSIAKKIARNPCLPPIHPPSTAQENEIVQPDGDEREIEADDRLYEADHDEFASESVFSYYLKD
jgi:hypothetical protein